VYGLRLRDHVTDAIIELHWLPIRATFQAVSAGPPGIERPVTELGRRAATACHHKTGLPSADNNGLLVPRTSLKFGARAFSVAGRQHGTAFQQTFRQPAPLQLSRRNSRLFYFIIFMTL